MNKKELFIIVGFFLLFQGGGQEQLSYLMGFTNTRGGTEGTIIRVKNLHANGPDSLAAAIQTSGPRLVVFEVGGVIDLDGQVLEINEPYITIAGQTAPPPGITLIQGGILIKTHDVIIQHIRVRPGDRKETKRSGWEIDGVSTYGASAYDIVVDHCSITWATDENLSASGPRLEGPSATSRKVTFSHNLIAEALHDSTHVKGPHSKGTLVHDFCQEIAVIGNFYAHNDDRNPYFKAHTTGVIVNNLIYNPGHYAIRLAFSPAEWANASVKPANGKVCVVGNVLYHGPDTVPNLPLIAGMGDAYVEDNLTFDRQGKLANTVQKGLKILKEKPCWPSLLKPLSPSKVVEYVLMNVGARPWDRDEIDKRILMDFQNRQGKILNSQEEVGGYPSVQPSFRPLIVPEKNREEWLQKISLSGVIPPN